MHTQTLPNNWCWRLFLLPRCHCDIFLVNYVISSNMQSTHGFFPMSSTAANYNIHTVRLFIETFPRFIKSSYLFIPVCIFLTGELSCVSNRKTPHEPSPWENDSYRLVPINWQHNCYRLHYTKHRTSLKYILLSCVTSFQISFNMYKCCCCCCVCLPTGPGGQLQPHWCCYEVIIP